MEIPRTISKSWSAIVRLFYRRIVLVMTLALAIGIAGLLWHLGRLQSDLVQAMAVQGASLQSQMFEDFRALYTSEVVERVRPLGVEVSHDYKEKQGAIPLPATFTIELGRRIGEKGSGMAVRLYSDYPFPWRKDGGPGDAFEREALTHLRANPGEPFVRFEDLQGRAVLRYATADRMRRQCIACHNGHPASPKTDWKEGDVRGVLEVIRPLSPVVAEARERLRGAFALVLVLAALGSSALGLVVSKLRHSSAELGQQVVERTRAQEELSKAHEGLKNSVGELESRNREAGTLSELADLLQSCLTIEEASGVIASSAAKLFHGFSGTVFAFSASRNVLEATTTWGRSSPAERVFSPNDCWALRRGHLHHSESPEGAVRCAHFGAESRLPSLCTPLMAQGETLGILCLVTEPNGAAGAPGSISEFNVKLAVSVAEQAALSFANLKLREKLRYQSIRDPLTGLFNRRFLDESLERELPRAIRKNRSLGIIMLDVDRFKKFNDMFGHDAGDTVLRELGDYLGKFIRRGDLACRYGGEEFTLILPESSLEDTRRRAEELRISFRQLSIKHRDIVLGKVTLSLGVAALPEHGTTAAELMAAADGALLRAKQEGRDRVLTAEVALNRVE